jgi:hypothetical protein
MNMVVKKQNGGPCLERNVATEMFLDTKPLRVVKLQTDSYGTTR